MSKVLVFGHQNPDTDSIASTISFTYLQQQLGVDAEGVALGEPNEETAFALDTFGFEAPRVITRASDETDTVMLVDHNEAQQSVEDIKDVTIAAVVDHHRIANFETAGPLMYRAEPVGCSNTIILKLYKENGIDIPKSVAGMMLSAIISDTLLFKSPTCTEQDIKAAKELAEIAGVDLEVYGLDLLKAGTNVDSKSEEELLNLDAKSFDMGDYTVRVAQVNTVDVNDVLKRQDALEADMKEEMGREGYDVFVLLITNILDSDSTILVLGADLDRVEEAFDVTLENNTALLKGVVSRKKQVVPQLTESYSK